MFQINKLIAVIEATAKAFIPGAVDPIAAGKAVAELVKSLRPMLSSNDQAKLDAALPAVLAKMNRDVDQAVKDLRG